MDNCFDSRWQTTLGIASSCSRFTDKVFTIVCAARFIIEWQLGTAGTPSQCAQIALQCVWAKFREVKLEREFAGCKLWLIDWKIRHSCVFCCRSTSAGFLHASNVVDCHANTNLMAKEKLKPTAIHSHVLHQFGEFVVIHRVQAFAGEHGSALFEVSETNKLD